MAANIYLSNKQLTISMSNTYEALAQANKKPQDGAKSQNWCASICNTLTATATELEQDVAFNELVETFSLSGDLLSIA